MLAINKAREKFLNVKRYILQEENSEQRKTRKSMKQKKKGFKSQLN